MIPEELKKTRSKQRGRRLSVIEAKSKNSQEFDYRFWIKEAYRLSKDKKFEGAIELYLFGLNMDPSNLQILCNLGWCHYQLQNYLKAINYFKLCLEQEDLESNSQDGKLVHALYGLGIVYLQLGLYNKAQSYVSRINKLPRQLNQGESRLLIFFHNLTQLVCLHTHCVNK